MSEVDKGRTETDALLDELLPDESHLNGAEPTDDGSPESGDWFGEAEPPAGTAPIQGDRTVEVMGGLPAEQEFVDYGSAQQIDSQQAPVQLAPGVQNDPAVPAAVPLRPTQLPSTGYADLHEEPKRRSRVPLYILLALLVIGGFGIAGYLIGTRDSTDSEADGSNDIASTALDPASAGDDGTAADGSGDEATDATGQTDDGAGESTTTEDTEAEAAEDFPAELSELTYSEMQAKDLPHAVIADGQVFVRGRVPNQAIADLAAARIEPILGEGNYFIEFTVDPTVPIYTAAPVYVEDVVLFDFNSTDLREQFFPLLELGTSTMERYPSVTVTIVAFTDAIGSEEVNLQVAMERARGVVEYWKARGIDPARISIDSRGEMGASENDDEQAAAYSRRVEFIFEGLIN